MAAEALAAEAVSIGASRPVGLSRLVCMADVSGSMSGTPMHVAIALGVLVSEVCHPVFRDKVLTFSGNPTWHQLQPDATFVEKATAARHHTPMGGTPRTRKSWLCSTRWACRCMAAL